MRQNDKILRYLTVRTDVDLKRAAARRRTAGRRSPPGGRPAAPGSRTGVRRADAAKAAGREGRED